MKSNGTMRFKCNSNCSGCPALPMTREQMKTALPQPTNELIEQLLKLEICIVFCQQRQQIFIVN